MIAVPAVGDPAGDAAGDAAGEAAGEAIGDAAGDAAGDPIGEAAGVEVATAPPVVAVGSWVVAPPSPEVPPQAARTSITASDSTVNSSACR